MFNGTESTDDTTISHYEWRFGETASETITTAQGTVEHTYAEPGTYTAELRVRDDSGNYSESVSVSIVVTDDTVPPVESVQVRYSQSANRSASTDLANAQVSGEVYIFAEPIDGLGPIATVMFLIDGVLEQTERSYPYDFGGGAGGGLARPYDTTQLSNGEHSITTKVTLSSGDVLEQITGFTVTNDAAVDTVPTARMSATPISGAAPLTVMFNGTESTDDTTISHYEWRFGETASETITTAQGTVEHTYAEPGTYTAELRVRDDSGNYSESVSVSIVVTDDTVPPVESVQVRYSQSANRSASTDLANAQVSGEVYIFAEPIDGLGPIATVMFLIDGVLEQTERSYPYDFGGGAGGGLARPYDTTQLSNGEHSITTKVTLSSGDVLEQITGFTVTNDAAVDTVPTARMSATPISGAAPLTVMFNGTESTDDTTISHYEWRFGETASETITTAQGTVEHTYAEPGTYTAELRVRDDSGNYSESVSVSIVVTDDTVPPVESVQVRYSQSANRSASTDLANAQVSGEVYIFAEPIDGLGPIATVMFLIDGVLEQTERSYPYDFGGGAGGGLARPYDTTQLSNGEHSITTKVTLSNGDVLEQITGFTVTNDAAVDTVPTARMSATPTSGAAALAVMFNGTESTDDTTISHYEWRFGETASETITTAQGTVEHTYAEPGTYTAELRVRDDSGNYSESVAVSIVVTDGNVPPASTVWINEFLAKNETGLLDDNNEREDWIELYNYGTTIVNLLDWCLSDDEDDPAQWCFEEDIFLEPNSYLVVIAGGDVNTLNPLYFHTNFKLKGGGEYLGLYEPNNAIPVDFYDPFPEQEDDQSYGKVPNGVDSSYLVPTPNAANMALPPPPTGALSFNFEKITTYGNSRIVELKTNTVGSLDVPYTLSVSEESTFWLSVNAISQSNNQQSDGKVEISVNASNLGVGSYVGVVTAQADGFEKSEIKVNLVVPDDSTRATEWEKADVKISNVSLPIDIVEKRVFYSIGPGYSEAADFEGILTYNEEAGYKIGINQGSTVSSGLPLSILNASYDLQMSIQLYKDDVLVDSYDLVLSNLPLVTIRAASIVDEPDRLGIFQYVSTEHSLSTDFFNMGIEYRGGTAQRYPKKTLQDRIC